MGSVLQERLVTEADAMVYSHRFSVSSILSSVIFFLPVPVDGLLGLIEETAISSQRFNFNCRKEPRAVLHPQNNPHTVSFTTSGAQVKNLKQMVVVVHEHKGMNLHPKSLRQLRH
ncbi:MAG TPA: hypothetical protein P5186_22070 [Candidatus Paceibacterota bacterium]|nr:hypothetical protein [Verrucomicrobiota bacterium]HRY50746.1 hypothetical protein [Candidatus Paceibacterota bacterium]HSA03917.1 hypothetical protein [Candidatus Paceibacterota bacterium]